VYQPELGSESADLHTGAMAGDEAVPDARLERWIVVTLVRGSRRVCHSGISNDQKDGRNRGGFLYSERRSTAGGGIKVPAKGVGTGGVDLAVTEQWDEDQESGGRRM